MASGNEEGDLSEKESINLKREKGDEIPLIHRQRSDSNVNEYNPV